MDVFFLGATCILGDAGRFSGAADWITYMYGETQGFITRAVIRGGFRQWHFNNSNLAEQEYDGENIYVSMNSFFKTYRRTSCLKKLNALYIDIDCYKLGLSKEDALSELDRDIIGKSIPTPTFVIDSGRGLYLIWKISEDVNALPRWKRVMKYLYESTKELGTDPAAVEPCRILRAPFSVNSGSGTRVKILRFYDHTYTLYEILRDFNITKKKCQAGFSVQRQKEQKAPMSTTRGQRQDLLIGRIRDVEALYTGRKGPDCRRENALFLFRHWHCLLTGDPEYALRQTLEFNSRLDTPHDERYVITATASAEKKVKDGGEYRFSNTRLTEFLDITPEEEARLNFIKSGRASGKARKSEKNRSAYLSRLASCGQRIKADKLSERRAAMETMLYEGKNREYICAALGISVSTYKRDRAVITLKTVASDVVEVISNAVRSVTEAANEAAECVFKRGMNEQKVEESAGSKIKPLYYREQLCCSVSADSLDVSEGLVPHGEELLELSSP